MICRTHGTTHTKMDELHFNSSVCEHKKSKSVNAMQTPEVEIGDLNVNKMLGIPSLGYVILPREYPVLYWFKIYHDKNLKKGKPVYSSLVPSFFNKKVGTITEKELMP